MDLGLDGGAHGEGELERFLRDVTAEAVLPPGISAPAAASAVICTLMQRMSGAERWALVEALPDALRPLFDSCVAHPGVKADPFDREQFFARVAQHLELRPVDAAALTRAVFSALRLRLGDKEASSVAAQLPRELEAVWLAPPQGVPPHP